MLLHQRLEKWDLRQRVRRLDVEPRHFQQDPDSVAGVGLDLVQPHSQAVGFLGPTFLVQEIDQRPACLWHDLVQAQRLGPASLREVVPPLLVMGFPLEELDQRGLLGRLGPDRAEVVKGRLRVRVGRFRHELSHEQMGLLIRGIDLEMAVQKRLCLLELADTG